MTKSLLVKMPQLQFKPNIFEICSVKFYNVSCVLRLVHLDGISENIQAFAGIPYITPLLVDSGAKCDVGPYHIEAMIELGAPYCKKLRRKSSVGMWL